MDEILDAIRAWLNENVLYFGTAEGMADENAVTAVDELRKLVDTVGKVRKFYDDNLADFTKVKGEGFTSVTYIRARRGADKTVEEVRTLSI